MDYTNESTSTEMVNASAYRQWTESFRWSAGANVAAVWRRYGWVPPTEVRDDYLFKQNRGE
jgi:hypothetical protein